MESSSHPYADLSPVAVLEAVESLGFETDARIFPLNSYENRVYQVGLVDKPSIIVKFYRPERWTTAQILEEHSYTLELVELEIPVVPPIAFGSAGTLVAIQKFPVFSFRTVPRTPSRIRQLG